jgi:hypothetical protein
MSIKKQIEHALSLLNTYSCKEVELITRNQEEYTNQSEKESGTLTDTHIRYLFFVCAQHGCSL